jgi:hypothetical protein
LIHILHDDDFVVDGYYREIETLACKHPDIGLYATRNFFVDDDSIILGVSERVRELERPARAVEPFLYMTPIQCAAVTVRRSAYEAVGGFRSDMGYVTDCEMWVRMAGSRGAIVSPKVLASYRMSDGTETRRVLRSAEGVWDICRLNSLLEQRYPQFSVELGRDRVSRTAWDYYLQFKRIGDGQAAAANYAAWKKLTPAARRFSPRFANDMMARVRRARQLGLRGTLSRIGAKLSSTGS